jgi:hypothetical protein
LTRWVHSAFRQLSSAQKREAQSVRKVKAETRKTEQAGAVATVIEHAHEVSSEGESLIPAIALTAGKSAGAAGSTGRPESQPGEVSLALERVTQATPVEVVAPKGENVARTEAILKLLFALDLIDDRDDERLELVAGSILAILDATDE